MVTERQGTLDEAAIFLIGLLDRSPRVAVVGRPGIGKSSVVNRIKRIDREIVRADDGLTSADVAAWFRARVPADRWLAEGVGIARAIHAGALVPDAVLWLVGPPVRTQLALREIGLGDAVDRWVRDAVAAAHGRAPWAYNVTRWRVAERKAG